MGVMMILTALLEYVAAVVLFIIWSCWAVLCSHSISGNISGAMLEEYMPRAVALLFLHLLFHPFISTLFNFNLYFFLSSLT